MSFLAYLNNIQTRTAKKPEDFKGLAIQKGLMINEELSPKTKAGDIVKWLKEDFDLGHGHAMAIYAYLKGKREQTMIVEVFKTDINCQEAANEVLTTLIEYFPTAQINFDLEDRDKILRIKSLIICIATFKRVLNQKGYYCEVLD
ncbi:MAG: DUF4287 domain-containing protein [Pelobium sp.]